MTPEALVTCPWFWRGMVCIGILALAVGGLSVIAPGRSIGLYQWIMERFNWRVTPIDAARELRTTRWLGLLLIALGVLALWLRFCRRF